MVVDCSKPHNSSVNNCTNSISAKFSYKGVDTVQICWKGGTTCVLYTLDIKDTYRAVSIHPDDRVRQGLWGQVKANGEYRYFYDNRRCMGLASSPYIFSRISNFVVR